MPSSTRKPSAPNSGPRWSMVGRLIARRMRSGTGDGPGICRKWRPVGWKSSVTMRGVPGMRYRKVPIFCIQNSDVNAPSPYSLRLHTKKFAYKIGGMTAEVISIPRASLHEQVAQRLRQMLVEGRIAPGAKLNERELSELLKGSRTPLREAIKMLAAEGLVELLPNRGAIAVALSEMDVVHTFEVMAGLEGMNGALAAQRITAPEL